MIAKLINYIWPALLVFPLTAFSSEAHIFSVFMEGALTSRPTCFVLDDRFPGTKKNDVIYSRIQGNY